MPLTNFHWVPGKQGIEFSLVSMDSAASGQVVSAAWRSLHFDPMIAVYSGDALIL